MNKLNIFIGILEEKAKFIRRLSVKQVTIRCVVKTFMSIVIIYNEKVKKIMYIFQYS